MAEAKKAPAKKKTAATKKAAVKEIKPVKKTKEIIDGDNQEISPTTAGPVDQGSEKEEVVVTEEKVTAKAGKRSAKAIAEKEAVVAKEERKAKIKEEGDEPAVIKHVTPTRSRLERAGKKLREAAKLVDKTKEYSAKEALELAVKTSTTKFDATVELHINLGLDPRQADQNLRDNLVLPAGTGKSVRVAVFAEADDVAIAKKAGAEIAGNEEFMQQLDKGTIDFDLLIATPAMMPKLGKYARLLGPKGMMPNPKSGTVTTNIKKAVEEAKAGRVEYRVDSTGIVHVGIGKVSFGADKLMENAAVVFASIKSNKPASVKGNYVKAIYAATTMGPSIRITNSEI